MRQVADLYWDPVRSGRLAIMARPRSGEWLRDEISSWRDAGVTLVLSLLEHSEIRDLDLGAEASICADFGIDFLSYPIPDRGVPGSVAATAGLSKRLNEKLAHDATIAIHCRAGIGRSSLIAACVLSGQDVDHVRAFEIIGKARRVAVPDTSEQIEWVKAFSRHR